MSDLLDFEPALAPDDGAGTEPLPFDVDAEPFPAPTPGAASALPRIRLASRSRARPVRPILPTAPALFPWLARRFVPGEMTLWVGPRVALDPMLEMLYAGSAAARGRISLLEGGNRFHPYRIGELGRSLGVDPGTTLHRLRLARAFTAYQMVALVDGWAAEARRHPSTLLVAHDLPAMFAVDEIRDDERAALLAHVARTLGTLLERVRVPLLLTLDAGGIDRFPGLADAGPRWADVITFARGPTGLRLRALRDDARLALVPRPGGQHGLEEYGRGTAEEVVAWGAPPRRIVKRSRSG
ncbi:MAG TPA: hypothetical protein VMC82_06080 [Thermoplasmata archaeon]|nr:hypothetical protein [Thermoplasmata archaeon]